MSHRGPGYFAASGGRRIAPRTVPVAAGGSAVRATGVRTATAPPAVRPSVTPATRGDLPDYARLFGDARRILGLSEAALARSLATTPLVVRALETGDAGALPPWAETQRIVTSYLTSLGIDPRPTLHVLAQEIRRASDARARQPDGGVRSGGKLAARVSAAPRRAAAIAMRSAGGAVQALASGLGAARRAAAVGTNVRLPSPVTRTVARIGRRAVRRAVLGFVVPALAALAVANADVVRAGAAALPRPVTRALAQVAEQVRVHLAPVREGLRWIEVEDPRSRRGDKLQTARR